MATRMLIDAAHPEETRVVIVKGNRLEEFDFEVESRKPLKGNIYLAKVTRVEPSLQAAFVDFGGNRHGFLAFNEIHPDYYQIPVADREALIAEQQREVAREAEAEEAEIEQGETRGGDAEADEEEQPKKQARDKGRGRGRGRRRPADDEQDLSVEDVGGDELDEEVTPRRPSQLSRPYKIQEVIKRRQILLVQVVKEERGNKGAALTTYLSLAGRYCVLMPNTARGGGISRKIANVADRRKLKGIVKDLDVPDGTGVIVRTAGAARTKAEIKRDFEFLLRLWDDIRDLTLRSTAPTLVYEEASLITRAIRDLYSKDIDEVLVDGDGGYRVAKDFMKRIMPSHAKRVQPYKDRIPLFHRYQVEPQLDTMYSPEVTLPSGGYIVMNSTEALVAIDVNSGKSTKGRSIEETATKTNLEAAEEVARQLRLRDLAGLIVIDFIDMEEQRNNRSVERKLKECLRVDRARIQVGRISHFGLLEMSRQRLRPGVQDVNMERCSVCNGVGTVRSIDSTALHVLRAIEEEGIRERSAQIRIHVPTAVAIYIVNNKRRTLAEIEERYNFQVELSADPELTPPEHRIERLAAAVEGPAPVAETSAMAKVVEEEPEPVAEEEAAGDEEGGRSRGRRRRRRKGAPEGREEERAEAVAEADQPAAREEHEEEAADDDEDGGRRRRRGRRGGRRRRGRREGGADGELPSPFPMAAAVPGGDNAVETPAPEPLIEVAISHDEVEPAEPVAEAEPSLEAEPATEAEPSAETEPSAEAEPVETVAPEAEPEAEAEPEGETTPEASEPEAEQPPAEPAETAETATGSVAQLEDTSAGDVVTTAANPLPTPANEERLEAEDEDSGEAEEAVKERETAEAEASPPKRGWWRRRPRIG